MDRHHFRRVRAIVLRPILELTILAMRLVSWSTAQSVGRACGAIAWRISRTNRKRALDQLAIAFPDQTDEERAALAREAFRHQLMNVSEYFHLAGRGSAASEQHIEVEGWEHVERARADRRPLIVITGHCGNWELLGAVFGSRRVPLAAVVRGLGEKQFEPMLDRLRSSFGTRRIARGEPGSVRELLAALRGGAALLMLIDQDFKTPGVFVPFFGRLAHTPAGAARLALRRRVTALPAFMERREDGTHLASFGAPFELPDDETEATAVMTRAIESQIRHRPEQWVWWHRRWRRRPPRTAEEAATGYSFQG